MTIGIESSSSLTQMMLLDSKKSFAEKVKDLVEVLKNKNINEAFEK